MIRFWQALALMLVLEGCWLFGAPRLWRRMVVKALGMDDGGLRLTGFLMLAGGAMALYCLL